MMSENLTELIAKVLERTADAEETERFEKWLLEAEANRVYFEQVRILWERTSDLYNSTEFNTTGARAKIVMKIQRKQARKLMLKAQFWIPAAASILLLLSVGYFAIRTLRPGNNDYLVYTSGNSVREITLPDSSRIWLNENSLLRAPTVFSGNYRKLILEGEAFFEVRKDHDKPFKVSAGNTIIKVLGTSFDIVTDKASGNVRVCVKSGKVAFYRSHSLQNTHILSSGMMGLYSASDHVIKISDNIDKNYLSWKTGELIFYDTPLNEVCKIVSEHYRKKVMTDIEDSNLMLTGSFQNETLEDVLKTIQLTLDIEVSVSDSEILLHN
jgi:transmembrane sensor